jgi:hypothetical protein
MSNHEDNKEIAKDIVLNHGATVAKIFGVVCPPAAVLGAIADSIGKRRAKKFAKRLEKLIISLEKRVKRLEDVASYVPDVDLFDEIVAKAISDEDEDKTEFYAALIEYCISKKPEPYEIRLLSKALKELTIYDMAALYEFAVNQKTKTDMPQELEEIHWGKIQNLGLFKGGSVRYPHNATILGKKIIEIYKLAMPLDG